jgi:hypothetical protein
MTAGVLREFTSAWLTQMCSGLSYVSRPMLRTSGEENDECSDDGDRATG